MGGIVRALMGHLLWDEPSGSFVVGMLWLLWAVVGAALAFVVGMHGIRTGLARAYIMAGQQPPAMDLLYPYRVACVTLADVWNSPARVPHPVGAVSGLPPVTDA